jgi:hypothetical protein
MGHILITVEDETPMLHFAGESPEETSQLKDLFARWLPLWEFQMKGGEDPNFVAELVKSQGLEWLDDQIVKGCESVETVGTDDIGTGRAGHNPRNQKNTVCGNRRQRLRDESWPQDIEKLPLRSNHRRCLEQDRHWPLQDT